MKQLLTLQDFVIKHWLLRKYPFTKTRVGQNEKKQGTDYYHSENTEDLAGSQKGLRNTKVSQHHPYRTTSPPEGPLSVSVYSFIPRHHYMWNARNPATKAKRVLKQRPTALKQVSRHPLPHQVLSGKNQPLSSDIYTQEVWFPGNTNQST